MPDFEKFKLGAPVKAEFQFRGDVRHAEVDGHFDVVVPAVSKSETTLVATLADSRTTLEFRLIEGRLFRQFYQYGMHLWTLDDLRNRKPPTVRGLPLRQVNLHRETPLLGSRWLDWHPNGDEPTVAARARVQKLAPQAWEAVETRMQTAASTGLRIVEGVLFHETRSPAYGFGPRDQAIEPMMPDQRDVGGSVLLDPGMTARELSSVARRVDKRLDRNKLRIWEPALLPDTVPSDAVAAFAIWSSYVATNFSVGNCDMDRMIDILQMYRTAEKTVEGGLPLDGCYAEIAKWPAHRRADRQDLWGPELATAVIADEAALFMELRDRFSPKPTTASPTEVEADDIENAFRP